MIKLKKLLALSATGLALAACGNSESQVADESIRVASSPGPYSEMFFEVVAPILEEEGYIVEEIEFTDLRTANVGLQEGSADLNVDQHTLYMENFNDEAGADLENLTAIPTVPTAMFPSRKDDLEAIAEGDIVAVPDDPSNMTRALLLLEKVGWITLDHSVEPIDMTENDIIENSAGIDIHPVQSATIPSIAADVDYSIIPGSIAYDAGVDFTTALVFEDPLEELMLQAVVPADKADSEWADVLVEAYQSEEVKAAFEEQNEESGQAYWIIPE